jgi:zinc protease
MWQKKKILIIVALTGLSFTISNQVSANINGRNMTNYPKLINNLNGIKEYELKNGLKIILKQNHNIPLVTFSIWYRVGSRNEYDGIRGISHFLEHMMFKGTKKLKKGEIASTIQKYGGTFNAFTFTDGTAYYETIPPKYLEKAIQIESDRMRNSLIDQDELNLEKNVVLSELEGDQNNPAVTLDEKIKFTAFNNSPYKHPVIGYREDINKINSKIMKDYYLKYYAPNNAFIVLSGDFKEANALSLIKAYFGEIKPTGKINQETEKDTNQIKENRIKVKKSGTYKLIQLSYHIPEFKNEDLYALNVIEEILFKGKRSPLYKKLIDNGLATEISGGSDTSLDPGLFNIVVSLTPKATHKQVEKIITDEINSFIKTEPKEKEVTAAKNRIKANYFYGLDGSYSEAVNLGYYEIIDNWTTSQELIKRINNVSKTELPKIAKKYLKKENRTIGYFIPILREGEKYKNESINVSKTQHYKKTSQIQSKTKKLEYKKKILNNGSVLLHYNNIDLPITYLSGIIPGGSSLLPKDKEWQSELITRIISDGSENYSKKDIEEFLDNTGSIINFACTDEGFKFDIVSLNENLDRTIELFNDIITNPKFKENEVKNEKNKIIAELIESKDDTNEIARRKMSQIIYPKDHPYYIDSFENEIKAIKKIKANDLYKTHKELINGTAIVSLVSNIKGKELENTIRGLNLGIAYDKKVKSREANIPNVQLRDIPKFENVFITDKEQSDVYLTHISEVNRLHPDFYKMNIANYILGGGTLNSRLSTKVRDQSGLVYTVYSYLSGSFGVGEFGIYFGSNNKNVDKAIEIINKELKIFTEKGITEKELAKTKISLVDSFTSKYLSSYRSIGSTILAVEFYKLGNNYINDYPRIIHSLKLSDVNKAIKKYILPTKLNTVVAGEYKTTKPRD